MNLPTYIYPPRPEVKIPSSDLHKFDDGTYFGQTKYNGSCCVLFVTETDHKAWNRHKEPMSNFKANISTLHRGKGQMVLCGEYLNKSQPGEGDSNLNHKFVIWDIIGYENEWLIGATTEQRLELLETLYPCHRMVVNDKGLQTFKHLCCTDMDDVFKAPTYTHGFYSLYNEIVKTPLYEGFVLKKRDAKLEMGFGEKNNTQWQLKCRKQTKNYPY